jgi:hypothetical protein
VDVPVSGLTCVMHTILLAAAVVKAGAEAKAHPWLAAKSQPTSPSPLLTMRARAVLRAVGTRQFGTRLLAIEWDSNFHILLATA